MPYKPRLIRPKLLVTYLLPDIAATGRSGTYAARPTGLRPHELLLKELEERNCYARTLTQGYVSWYAFFVTLNFGIIGLSFTKFDLPSVIGQSGNEAGRLPLFGYVAGLFLTGNLLALVATWALARSNRIQKKRFDEVIAALNSSCESAPRCRMMSPYPYSLFRLVLIMLGLTLGGVALFWFYVLVKP